MNNPVDRLFRQRAQIGAPTEDTAEMGGFDEALTGYLDGRLNLGARRHLENQVLEDPALFELFRLAVDTIGVTAPRPFRVLARIKDRGLELLNEVDLAFRALLEPGQPALGALRRQKMENSDLVTLFGPGEGIDELDLQVQPDQTTRLIVRCTDSLDVRVDETISITLDTDGELREKHPFNGDSFVFPSLMTGQHTVRLVARAPGRKPRTLAEAQIDLAN
jgi:hypothetical protein